MQCCASQGVLNEPFISAQQYQSLERLTKNSPSQYKVATVAQATPAPSTCFGSVMGLQTLYRRIALKQPTRRR